VHVFTQPGPEADIWSEWPRVTMTRHVPEMIHMPDPFLRAQKQRMQNLDRGFAALDRNK
jgi:hypothetical protein